MDKKAFFEELRKNKKMFPQGISQEFVNGVNTLLEVWYKYNFDKTQTKYELAYNLATSFHETAGTMQPIYERGAKSYFNKYEPGTKLGKQLGNTQRGDGFLFRGAGHVQNTGRRNADVSGQKLSKFLNVRVDFLSNPALRVDPTISAISLFLGNHEGWWTGRKLNNYLRTHYSEESELVLMHDFTRARAVVNGNDKAELIATYAFNFLDALDAAKYKPVKTAPITPITEPKIVKSEGWFSALVAFIAKLFGGKK